MKHPLSSVFGRCGFALIELLISTTIIAITGGIIYNILYTGMTLFAKNTAINMAHQEARVAVLQMEQDLHGAVSIPQLTDATGTPIAGNGPAAGISFQLFAAGPFQITPSATATPSGGLGYLPSPNTSITVRVNGYTPSPNQRLIIPTHQIEADIASVGGGTTDRQLTLGTALPVEVDTTLNLPTGMTSVNVNCFITDRVTYLVQGSQLLYYGRKNATPRVMANDLTAAIPFSIPQTPLGAPYNRFVAAINLSTADVTTSNRHFRAANMFLNAREPFRARLCIYQ